ncbi:AAA domain-containing protein [Actinomadura sp. WMMB 499]|uniref:caspase, EACC1-associated type n=1 Tax=Actinomadura sp. WMMB 499 TaxID=1219491 RepID=UPI0012463AE0|nr:AAA domain-containing protein [Actinomadura sp. WMMB 499]QFG23275.1 AAA family ATPase [Actinomadura sp. WMMB 499]
MSDNDRYAMLVGVSTYDSANYHDLPAVRADLHYMQAVLENTQIGMYNGCAVVAEPTRIEMLHAVESYLEERQQSETALLYFSGHGEFCEQDNQLYFLTRDTDPDDLPGTAVPAQFLERMLQSCRAASKLVLLDCCSSGSVVQGWTAKGGDAPSAREDLGRSTLLHPTGVYFITASDALQAASAMAPPDSTLGTSRFTGEIVEGLRNGRIANGPWVTPDNLFDYLTNQMARNGIPEEQRPTRSIIRATRSLPFARSVASTVHLPPPPAERGPVQDTPALRKARELAEREQGDATEWQSLLRYYADCLGTQTSSGMTPDRLQGRNREYFLIGDGAETLQSGQGPSLPVPSGLPQESPGDAEYWYGYPALTLPSSGTRRQLRAAPLLLQQLELVPDESGRATLRPTGVPSVHAGVVKEFLRDEEAADVIATWQPTWQEGNEAQMIGAVRELLKTLGINELEPLVPAALSGQSFAKTLRPGAHNAAMVLARSRKAQSATIGLEENLLAISARAAEIPGTALGALLPGGPMPAEADPRWPVVAAGPCNESQEQVVASAMTRPLTVATGPPGTGKSEVVTSVVTTCVAAGQTVLVASTNNEAVNVVAERCDAISPGLLMRTGNVEALKDEAAKIERLLQQGVPRPPRASATVSAELRDVHARAAAQRAEADSFVDEEERLRDLIEDREAMAASLELPAALLSRAWTGRTAPLARWETRARKAADARRWFPGLRRARALKALVAATPQETWPAWTTERPVPPARLTELAHAVSAERNIRELLPRHLERDEEQLRLARQGAATLLSHLSHEHSQATSAESVARARTLLADRLQTLRDRRGYRRSQRKLMREIKAWATSTHSVRRLELAPKLFDLVVIDEASQCSIAAVLPLLFRARRALIIGDPMQLGHIGISPQQERQARRRAGLSAAYLEDRRLAFHAHSSYHAAERRVESTLLLDEHYRCHPEIADVVNGHCYAGRLQVLTDVRRQVPAVNLSGAAPVLAWADVPESTSMRGPGQRSWWNRTEADAVRHVVEVLLGQLPETATVGVVTPFRAQMDELARMLQHERIRVGTVHAFQGGQRDVMVLSPVATHNTPAGTAHWVASQMNLWNVAITRAKSQLITVGSRTFWQSQEGLPTLLAERSIPLGKPTETVAPPPSGKSHNQELGDRLQRYLGTRGVTDLERDALVGGQLVDLLYTADGENVAVLIDPGPEPDHDRARHLRLTHARSDLLTGLPSGGMGAKEGPVNRTVRIPAWRALAGDEHLGPLLP